MSGNVFNKYCLDCKQKKTTQFIVYLGIFVCMDCATLHSKMKYFTQSDTYIKDVLNEQWDDWQLKSVQIGGNKKLFDVMKEYDIHEFEFSKKYSQPIIKYYKNRHMALLDGVEKDFDAMYQRPPKTYSESFQRKYDTVSKTLEPRVESFESTSAGFSQMIDNGAAKLGAKIKEKWR